MDLTPGSPLVRDDLVKLMVLQKGTAAWALMLSKPYIILRLQTFWYKDDDAVKYIPGLITTKNMRVELVTNDEHGVGNSRVWREVRTEFPSIDEAKTYLELQVLTGVK